LTLAVAFIVPFAVSSRLSADTIVRTSGQRLEGVEITKAGWDQVLYKKNGNTAQLPGDKIASIVRDSRSVQRIRGPLDSGDYAKAAAAIPRAEGGAQGWELAEVEYLKGRVYLESGEYRKADSAFATYIQKHQESKDYWIPHAVLGRGKAAIANKLGGAAQQHFKDLRTYGDTWSVHADLGEAQGKVLKKQYADARSLFSRVARDRNAPPSLKADATVGKIKTMVLQEQYAAAIKELERSFFSSGAADELASYGAARAEATLLMGVSYQKQGGKPNLEHAEIWFLRTAVLYRAQPSIYRDACKELQTVYKALSRADRAAEWGRRAKSSS
jgi:tetratricopeptide (TPR) repeat protein